MIRWLFRVPFWIGLIGLIFVYGSYEHRAQAEQEAVPLRCGSPELAEVDHIRLSWCVVESTLAQRGRYSPAERYWFVLRAPGATEVSAIVTMPDDDGQRTTDAQAAEMLQDIERELASGELELFRSSGEGGDAVLRARPELRSVPFVGTRTTPQARVASSKRGMWVGAVFILFDVIRSSLILIWALRRHMF